jgi:hypothetical protein
VTAAHVVHPDDEARHKPDEPELWNESYYCDFVQIATPPSDATDSSTTDKAASDDADLWGGWLRLGLYPNRRVAWWTAWLLVPGSGVCSVDYSAPVPAGNGLTSSGNVADVEVEIVRPLEEFRLCVPQMQAKRFSRPEDAYVDTGWEPTTASLNLTWTTDGVPYHYVLTTRYEIPCLVAGSVTVDDQTFHVNGQGQRDHSWGVRDWWAFGWCWSSARLDDGTRIHLADIRVPGSPAFFGYVQIPTTTPTATAEPQSRLLTVTSLTVNEDLGPVGFPRAARIELTAMDVVDRARDEVKPLELKIDVEPLAYGPVLLRDEDGRTSRFPRALVRYRADDGRCGAGWIEWNQPQP